MLCDAQQCAAIHSGRVVIQFIDVVRGIWDLAHGRFSDTWGVAVDRVMSFRLHRLPWGRVIPSGGGVGARPDLNLRRHLKHLWGPLNN